MNILTTNSTGSCLFTFVREGPMYEISTACFIYRSIFAISELRKRHVHVHCAAYHFRMLFKNPRDASQIQHLARQMYPQDPLYLVDVYDRVMSLRPYSYLFMEMPEYLRLRANMKDEERFYQRKGYKIV